MKFPFYRQINSMDCGPACLKMVAKYYGKSFNIESLRNRSGYIRSGVSLLGISDAAELIGFSTRGVQLSFEDLIKEKDPCILHWEQSHFVIFIPIRSENKKKCKLQIADPALGIISLEKHEFLKKWLSNEIIEDQSLGTALLLKPEPRFNAQSDEDEKKAFWKQIVRFVTIKKRSFLKVIITMIIASGLQLLFPFLTQNLVDKGINKKDVSFITLILISQLMLIFSRSVIEFIRSKILLGISNFVNISMLSEFWMKITKLPINYFDRFHTGDTMQRLQDNRQVQSFITGNGLDSIFSIFSFILYSVLLGYYNVKLFIVFIIGSVAYLLWIKLFLKVNRNINYKSFYLSATENNLTIQLVQGMQELKLNNAEKMKRLEWEKVQGEIFQLEMKALIFNQYQQSGALLLSHGKDAFLTFMVANMVLESKLTFGAMLAIQFVLGQLSGPIEHFVSFVQQGQNAKISLERLNEIHELSDEIKPDVQYSSTLPTSKSISFKNFEFRYPGSHDLPVLKNINLEIPEGKTTAIVGTSGSGKTTLIKILLKFYEDYKGQILVSDTDLKGINPNYWRSQCGTVLQEGYIFDDTIANNIAVGETEHNPEKLANACQIANIQEFIESLPNGLNTELGSRGLSVSQGQKQRILIARAVYKDPEFMFFDEATNALDANNEKIIVQNLSSYFKGRTVIIVAHRLSTVRFADKIIVLQDGYIVETGNHEQLIEIKGAYFELVHNQLELGA